MTNFIIYLHSAHSLSVRFKASCIHLGISMSFAALAAAVVFFVWYPYPFSEVSGGRELFFMLIAVDVVIGPLITLLIFNPKKPINELRRDLAVLGLLQCAALMYGVWSIGIARPVHMVFEIDRFRVVHAIDVPVDMLAATQTGIIALPWSGPTMLAVRPFKNDTERMADTIAALEGLQLGYRPDLWIPYSDAETAVLIAAKPVRQLKAKFPSRTAEIDLVLEKKNRRDEGVLYLPLVGRRAFWTAFLDPITAEVIATMPLDPY